MKTGYLFAATAYLAVSGAALAADHRVEVLQEGPPAGVLSEAIARQISSTGVKVVRGEKRTVCEIWLCKEWTVKPGFKPDSEVLYPFEPGQLVGVLRYRRRGYDFRDQQISKGVYTLRYGQQPVDGEHVGTSPTRDFLLMVRADKDTSTKPVDPKSLQELSAEAAETTHPGLLCMKKVQGNPKPQPVIYHDQEHDWWITTLRGTAKEGDKTKDLFIDLIVVGHAAE